MEFDKASSSHGSRSSSPRISAAGPSPWNRFPHRTANPRRSGATVPTVYVAGTSAHQRNLDRDYDGYAPDETLPVQRLVLTVTVAAHAAHDDVIANLNRTVHPSARNVNRWRVGPEDSPLSVASALREAEPRFQRVGKPPRPEASGRRPQRTGATRQSWVADLA